MNTIAKCAVVSGLAVCVVFHAAPTAAQTFNPANDFSTSTNSNGVWSYGWSQSLGGVFNLDTFFTTSDYNFTGIDMWQGRQSGDYPPWVGHNSTGVSHALGGTATMLPGDLALHPGKGGEYSVLRWTAPATGSYSVVAAFSGIDIAPTTTDVHVLRNGISLFNGTVSVLGAGPTYSGSLFISTGDTIDFAVGYGANQTYFNDSTKLSASLVTASEPASLVMLLSGILAICAHRRAIVS